MDLRHRIASKSTNFWSTFALVLILVAASVFLQACTGGRMASGTPTPGQNTTVTFLISSSVNDQLSVFGIGITSINLSSQSGQVVNVFSSAGNPIEFIHVNGTAQALATVSVPQDTYTAAAAAFGNSDFTNVGFVPPNNIQASTFENGLPTGTINLPSPIHIGGSAMTLLLSLEGPQSYAIGPPSSTIAPAFSLTVLDTSAQPTNSANGLQTNIDGQISSVSASGSSFVLATADHYPLSIRANASTQFQNVANFAALTQNTFVDLDAAVQPDGSLLATRVAVLDPAAVDVFVGPVTLVNAGAPILNLVGRSEQGPDFVLSVDGNVPYDFQKSTFQISNQFPDLQALPFVPVFNASTIFAGQNVYITSFTGPNNSVPSATTITLMPQTIDATVTAVSVNGSFQVFQVVLAFYDPVFNLQTAMNISPVISNPSTVFIYVGSDTPALTSSPLGIGSVARFHGLLFDDNGTLRMAAMQVSDGVPE